MNFSSKEFGKEHSLNRSVDKSMFVRFMRLKYRHYRSSSITLLFFCVDTFTSAKNPVRPVINEIAEMEKPIIYYTLIKCAN